MILANRWRPQTFKTVIGQDWVVQSLTNALNQQKLHHAYLFTGTRGVGKTSLARILAKGLNCQEKIQAESCGQCRSCLGIAASNSLDCFEIDAASRTKVEDTRELLELAQYPPVESRFKIFLIDEVHMLSGHSFNALLKTLEQPPEQVKFILATTDPQKVPDTVLSRCLQFQLQAVRPESLMQHLQSVVEQEAIQMTPEAMAMIVEMARGSVRDMMTLLQQVSNFDQELTLEQVCALLGVVPENKIASIIAALHANDRNALMQTFKELSLQTLDYHQLVEQVLTHLHTQAMEEHAPEALQTWIQIALLTKRDLDYYPTGQMAFELMLLRMLAFKPESPVSILTDWQSMPIPKTEAETTTQEPLVSDPPKQQVQSLLDIDWQHWIEKQSFSGMLKQLVWHTQPVGETEQAWVFAMAADKQPMASQTLTRQLEQYLKKCGFNKAVQWQIAQCEVPAEAKEKAEAQAHTKREQTLLQDPRVAALDQQIGVEIKRLET